MACEKPLRAWKYGFTKNGKQRLVFKRPENSHKVEMQEVPCGKCDSCKIDYSRMWATRITHELQVTGIGAFVTLTIDDDHLITRPFTAAGQQLPGRSVYKRTLQLWLKRLRQRINMPLPNGTPIYQQFKYFACGEYGDKYGRPHYHVILMGYDFPDKIRAGTTESGEDLYESRILNQTWPFGQARTADANWQSAAYTARYALKKQVNKKLYEYVDRATGEVTPVAPEFVMMSKGIGKEWWQKFASDTDKDFLVVDRDKTVSIPRYYDKLRERKDPESLAKIKKEREIQAKKISEQLDNNERRQRGEVKAAQIKKLKRNLDK